MNTSEFNNKYLGNRDILYKILLYTIYISFICVILSQMHSITNFSFTLHEMIFVELNLAIFIIPTEIIVLIYYSIIHFKEIRKATSMKNIKYKFKATISVISIILIFVYTYYTFNSFSSSGVFSNFKKVNEKNKYYIVINDKKIRCTKNEFNLIDVKKEYMIEFHSNKFTPEKGDLVSIKTIYTKH